MRKVLAVISILALAIVLTACSQIKYGTVHDKAFHPAYWTTQYNCYSYSKEGACTMNVPSQVYYPPEYSFDLYVDKDHHGWHDVTEGAYNKYNVGDYYDEEGKK